MHGSNVGAVVHDIAVDREKNFRFFKQKTAYEMRISDWSSDVCSSDLTDARIVLRAHQDAWVQVRDREGNLLLTRVLRVGDSYQVPNQADLTLLTGNAGGLEISVDGNPLPALGPVGAVRRNIPLDPAALLGGAGRQP